MDSQLVKRLTRIMSHKALISQESNGDKVFGDPVDRNCSQEGKIIMVRNTSGEEVVSSLQLYLDTLFPITALDEVVFDGRTYPIISFARFDGLKAGTGTTVVYL